MDGIVYASDKTGVFDFHIIMAAIETKEVYFWKPNQSFGWCSQWYYCKFIENGINFSSAEQYMMYHKAILFGDKNIAAKILRTTDPAQCKRLGRKVSNFDEKTWNEKCEDIVYQANILKFTQNDDLRIKIKELPIYVEFIEASPYDSIWGIGYTVERAKYVGRPHWGKNKLGKVLSRVRRDIESLL